MKLYLNLNGAEHILEIAPGQLPLVREKLTRLKAAHFRKFKSFDGFTYQLANLDGPRLLLLQSGVTRSRLSPTSTTLQDLLTKL